jgi:CRP-like cAMP-binding protein
MPDRYSITERTIALRTIPQMNLLPPRELHAIARSLGEKRYAAGDVLLAEHERPHSLFVLMRGAVTVTFHGVLFGTIRAPGGAGLLPFYGRTAGESRIVAAEETEALILDEDTLFEAMDEHFFMLQFVLRFLAERILKELRSIEAVGGGPTLRERWSGSPGGNDDPLGRYDPAALPDPAKGPLSLLDRIMFLRGTPQFRTANVNAIAGWARRLEERRYAAEERLWMPGDAAPHIAFIVHGTAEVRWAGNRLPAGPPTPLGSPEAILGQPRWSECVATTPVVVLTSPVEVLFDICEDDIEIGLSLAAFLANLLQAAWYAKALSGKTVY